MQISTFFQKYCPVSRTLIEILLTIGAAGVCVMFYNSSPMAITLLTVGGALVVPVLLKKPYYAVFFLAALLPFRDIHLVSIIHLKRAIIWTLSGFIFFRQITASKPIFSRPLSTFSKTALLFLLAITVSLIQTAAALHSTLYITRTLVKTSILSDALVIAEAMLLVYIIFYFITTSEQMQHLIDIILGVSACISVLAILQYYAGGIPAYVHFLFDPEYHFYGRATSVFSNPNTLGAYVAPMAGIAVVSFFWGNPCRKKRFGFLLPILLVNTWALLLSFSRGAVLQFFLTLLVVGTLYYTKISRKKLSWQTILLAGITCVLLISADQLYSLYFRTRLASYREQDVQAAITWIKTTSDLQRKNAALKAIQTFGKHPLLGIGYNLFAGKRVVGFQYFGLAVHNQYLKILVEMGLLGFIPFVLLLRIILKTAMRIWDKRQTQAVDQQQQVMTLLALTGISAILLSFLFADLLPVISITGYLWIFSGLVFTLNHHHDTLKP